MGVDEGSDDRVREEVVAFLDHRDDVRGEVSRRDEERTVAQKTRYDGLDNSLVKIILGLHRNPDCVCKVGKNKS